MKTKVITTVEDIQSKRWDKGERGYIDGYINALGRPCACVIIGNRIVAIPLHSLEVEQ